MTPSTPALVLVLAIEEPAKIYFDCANEGEQVRLEDDLRARGESLLESLADVLELDELRIAA